MGIFCNLWGQLETPGLVSLAESNINFNYNKKEIGAAFENYNIELKKMNPCPKKSRMAVFVKKTLNYSWLHNYENDLNSYIWIKISIEKNKPIYFGGGYRQFKLPAEMGLKDTRSSKNQITWCTAIKPNPNLLNGI